jgi:hypothetical protein
MDSRTCESKIKGTADKLTGFPLRNRKDDSKGVDTLPQPICPLMYSGSNQPSSDGSAGYATCWLPSVWAKVASHQLRGSGGLCGEAES